MNQSIILKIEQSTTGFRLIVDSLENRILRMAHPDSAGRPGMLQRISLFHMKIASDE